MIVSFSNCGRSASRIINLLCRERPVPHQDRNALLGKMSNEIADSDGDSDFVAGPSPQKLPLHQSDCGGDDRDRVDLSVDFNDLFNHAHYPEQDTLNQDTPPQPSLQAASNAQSTRLIDPRPRNHNDTTDAPVHNRSSDWDGVSETKHIPESMSSNTPTVNKNKRSHTTLTNGKDLADSDMAYEERSRKKRSRTYGSGSRHLSCSQTSLSKELFKGSRHEDGVEDQLHMQFGAANCQTDSPQAGGEANSPGAPTDMPPPAAVTTREESEDEDDIPRQRNRPRRVTSLLNEAMCSTSREVSTSRSSIGNYESINIDCRNSKGTLENDGNPFGSASPEFMNDVRHEANINNIEDILRLQADTSVTLPLSGTAGNSIAHKGTFPEPFDSSTNTSSFQSSGRSKTIDPSMLIQSLPNDTQSLPSSKTPSCIRRKRDAFSLRDAVSPVADEVPLSSRQDEQHIQPQPSGKKRGRKPKNHGTSATLPAPVVLEVHDLDSDELAIGLPTEQYKPRPSRSRGGTDQLPIGELRTAQADDEGVRERKQQETSPIKQPKNDLNLGDEAFVGIPKENYNPRPSGSRSRRDSEFEDLVSTTPDEGTTKQFELSSPAPRDDVTSRPVKKAKKDPKKSKVKRAKTSAAALLKKSEKMLSDGEEDVVWLESKPAKVKLDLPPDINGKRTAKEEAEDDQEDVLEPQKRYIQEVDGNRDGALDKEKTGDPSHRGGDSEKQQIVVNVPTPQPVTVQPEPKKRGRKRKQTTEIPPSDEAPTADVGSSTLRTTNADWESGIHRSALIERDTNMGTSASTKLITSGKSASATPPPQKDRQPDSVQQENAPPSPVRPADTPQKQDEKETGPTKHSPINPRGGKATYRVGLSKRAPIPPLLKMVRK